MSSASGATFGARRKYLSMSLGFADPARSRRKSSAARKEPTFSATAIAKQMDINEGAEVAFHIDGKRLVIEKAEKIPKFTRTSPTAVK
jgi:hypothetical protein